MLVAGHECADAAVAAAKVPGVTKVLVADAARGAARREHVGAGGFDRRSVHPRAGAGDGFGKNFMPRVAALLDVAQISDISGVESADTFVRPIYAGNVLATVQSKKTRSRSSLCVSRRLIRPRV